MYHQKSPKILLENFHLKNKLWYQPRNNLELNKKKYQTKTSTLQYITPPKETQTPQVKNIANLITENFAQAASAKNYSTNSTLSEPKRKRTW